MDIVLLSLFIVIVAAKIGGEVVARLKLPNVLGEILIGILMGNLGLIGFSGFEFLRHSPELELLSELGIMVLLFSVGLETKVSEMLQVGISSTVVACLGVITPFIMGAFVSHYFLPESPILVHIFVGATLTATSVGITARVLKDIGKLQSDEGKIILGAAVIDDVLGLIVLTTVSSVIAAANNNQAPDLSVISISIIKAALFFVGTLAIGNFLLPKFFALARNLRGEGSGICISLAICFGFGYLASLVGLAPIVGAFTAGLVLEPIYFENLREHKDNIQMEDLIHPIVCFLTPIFFVMMGIKVDLSVLANTNIILFALVLTLVAIIGKLACALGTWNKSIDRLAIGIGMIPRGEVGLIFASIGMNLKVKGVSVIDQQTYAAVIIMVMITTLITPPLLSMRMKQGGIL